ncbi:Na+/H+ antiporter [Antrihabitans sp. YC2-6]|nr:Na+/H+ antiporter [Antrihabitans sp. YC2-6]
MHIALLLVVLVGVAVALAAAARRVGASEPLVLVVAGVIGSYSTLVPDIEIEPDLILLGLLPPLLYTAAIKTSLVDFKANKRAIAFLSVGLVLFTTFTVALVVWWILQVPFAVAVALGAVVAPPDAVAATAVARKVGMPRRIVTILEGESLFNDATALVALRTAIAAIGGTVAVWEAGWDFLVAAGGGAAVGIAVAFLLSILRRRITDPVLDTSLSFLAPFVAYLPAEEIHASGVISVVICGLILGHNAPVWQSAASRIAERTNWQTIQFILESVVFLVIGLQVRAIVDDAWHGGVDHSRVILACAAVFLTVVVSRPLWVFPSTYLPRLIPSVKAADPAPGWRNVAVVSWAGMRGVVTLAAVLLLPEDTPHREVLTLCALVVVGGTLLLQGLSLPFLVRLLSLRGPSRAEDALQQAGLLQQATDAGLAELEANITPQTSPDVVASLRFRLTQRTNAAWERLGAPESEQMTPSEEYRRLRLQMLGAERAVVLEVRDSGVLDHEVLQSVMSLLDLEESLIDRFDEAGDDLREEALSSTVTGECAHLLDAPVTCVPDHPGICQECLDEGFVWVHLRMCLTCGHVACCDSSVGNHASAHFRSTEHPVMRSVEPGEAWRWCYVDNVLG